MGTWPSPITPLDELAFTFVDVETTGLDPGTGYCVCEIALLRVQGDYELARFDSLVYPQRPMHPGALAVHGITDAMLAGAPIFATLLPQIHALLQDAVLVAHNARFDVGFLRHEWQLARHTFPFLAVADTLALAQARYRFRHKQPGAIAHAARAPSDDPAPGDGRRAPHLADLAALCGRYAAGGASDPGPCAVPQ